MANRAIYISIDAERGVQVDPVDGSPVQSSRRPSAFLDEQILFCVSFVTSDLEPYVFGSTDTFDAGLDDNFDHTDDLISYTDNTGVNTGDWADEDKTAGKLSIRMSLKTTEAHTKLDGDDSLAVTFEIRRFAGGDPDKEGIICQIPITLRNVVIDDSGTPTEEMPEYYTAAACDARFARFGYWHVLDKDLTTPPVSPSEEDYYIIATGGTGAWAGGDGKVAQYTGTNWAIHDVEEGHLAYAADEDKFYLHTDTTWVLYDILRRPTTQKSSLVDADKLVILDSAASDAEKYATLANLKASVKLNEWAVPTAAVQFNSQLASGLATPVAASDAATRGYVDNLFEGRKWKQPVVVATTANITLSGEQTIDGVLTSASRVLVWQQSTGTENGIYVSAAGAWARADDTSTGDELVGAITNVLQGTAGADKLYQCTDDAITIGVTAITFRDLTSAYIHNALASIQGGTTNEYYHLTAAQHTGITGVATPGKLVKTTAAGVVGESAISEGSITGQLTIAKTGTTARTVTFPDAAMTVAGTNLAQTFSAKQTFSDAIDWTGGRVTLVPIGGDINTYITAATAGDTLVLASGTYTVTAAINVSKALTIIGQGAGRTVITCATAGISGVINITADNVTIRDLSVSQTDASSGTNYTVYANGSGGTVLTNVQLWNVNISTTASAAATVSLRFLDAGGVIRNCNIEHTATAGNLHIGIQHRNGTTAEAVTNLRIYSTRVVVTGSGTADSIYGFSSSSAGTATSIGYSYLYDCILTGTGGATVSRGIVGDSALSDCYAKDCIITGVTTDIAQTNSAVITLVGSSITNGAVSGTVVYGGNFVSAKLGVGGAPGTSLIKSYGDVEAAAAGAMYFGDPATNDSWRIVRSGNNLVIERRESGSWVTKSTISA
jgi:hypothetical protein